MQVQTEHGTVLLNLNVCPSLLFPIRMFARITSFGISDTGRFVNIWSREDIWLPNIRVICCCLVSDALRFAFVARNTSRPAEEALCYNAAKLLLLPLRSFE